VPSQPTPFIGRDRELAQLQRLLETAESRLITIVGPGGIGKTRLAVETASRNRPNFADGVRFVSLAAVTPPDQLLWAIADALEGSVVGSEAPLVQLITALHDQQLLLVLDNFEHLVNDGLILTQLLAGAPRLKILVTSRARLNLQGEWTLPLFGFEVPASAAEDDHLESYSAVQLFLQSAQRVQPDFALSGNGQAVLSICHLVEGMPLAIELAAAWVRLLPCAQIVEQLSSGLDFLTSPLRDAPERHRSLRAVFDHSWTLLSPAEQSALAKLSVFRGAFDRAAATAVADAPLPVLASLADKSLLQADGMGRYALHDLLRHYAAEKLASQRDAVSHQERAITYLNSEAERASNADDQRQAAAYLGQAIAIAEDGGKAALLVEVHQKRGDLVFAAMGKLGGVLTNDGNLEEAVDLYERTLAHGGNPQSDTHNGLGRTLYWLGRYHEAVVHLRRAVELEQGDPVNQIFPLQDLGLALAATGAYAEAVSVFEQSQSLSRAHEDWPLLARAVATSAGFHLDVFDYVGNQRLAEEARALARLADWVLPGVSAGLDLLVNFVRRGEIGRAAKLLSG
jgi:predicted ATPase